jgi:hypothetical protein
MGSVIDFGAAVKASGEEGEMENTMDQTKAEIEKTQRR